MGTGLADEANAVTIEAWDQSTAPSCPSGARRAAARAALVVVITLAICGSALAQQGAGWDAGVAQPPRTGGADAQAAPPAPPTANTTVVPGTDPAGSAEVAQVRLVALLTADGQRIDQGIVWRIYQEKGEADGKSALIGTHRNPSPVLKLQPGDYIVNAAFGRANLTRKISVKPSPTEATERFVLNAGGLRVMARISGADAPPKSVTYSIFSDRDQSDNRRLIMADVKPGLIVRLNAGIFHIVSTYGDANAVVASDVTVEAGKLSDAVVSHAAAKVTLKLVAKPGGEALAGTHWTILSPTGDIIKETSGALPTHILAPGTYTATAKLQDKAYQRPFTVKDGETTQVEVITQQQ